jgi:hypothetical protein
MRDYNHKVASHVGESYAAHQNNNSILGNITLEDSSPIEGFEIFISNKSSIPEDFNMRTFCISTPYSLKFSFPTNLAFLKISI